MIPHHFKACAAGVIGGAACVSPVFAAGKDDAGGTFGVYLENDLFAGGALQNHPQGDTRHMVVSTVLLPLLAIFDASRRVLANTFVD